MNNIIYLDMDGVCCDFPSAAIQAYGGNVHDVLAEWEQHHRGKSGNYEIMGMPDPEFWNTMNHQDEWFWRHLPEYPWFRTLYDGLQALAPVVFLSSAGPCPEALSGKLQWLQDRFGREFHDYVFTSNKQYLAHQGTILVDDYEVYVMAFRRAGGQAVLFPQMWGHNAHITERVSYTLHEVQQCLRLM
jgi:5'(3')-deoxyribonucleotidase